MKKILLVAVIAIFTTSAMFSVSSCKGKAKKQAEELVVEVEEVVEAPVATAVWADNDFTKLVPAPEMEVLTSGENDLGYSATFNNATIEQVKAYAAKVKEAGFNVNPVEQDGEAYSYTAKNAAGNMVTVNFAAGQSSVLITKVM